MKTKKGLSGCHPVIMITMVCGLLSLMTSCRKEEYWLNFESLTVERDVYYGPANFTIQLDYQPVSESLPIGNPYHENFENIFVLKVQYGNCYLSEAPEIEIMIGDDTIISSADFPGMNTLATKPISLSENSAMDVYFKGPAGCQLELVIEGNKIRRTVTDISGNTYEALKIGNYWWMSENLKTTMLNNGTPIPVVTGNTPWSSLSTPAYCLYDNIITNKDKYGVLYNWFTVTTGSLCPTGWRVPSRAEWQALATYLGGESIAGGKIKLVGTDYWESSNLNASNEVGFDAKPGGFRNPYNGTFSEEKQRGWWWSSTHGIDYTVNAFMAVTWNDVDSILIAEANERNGVYVRCIRDY